jgi:hypothetical protein
MGRRPALLLALAFAIAPCRAAEDAALAVQRIKAAFLYKFAAYVEWPASAFPQPATPIVIETAGAEPIASELEQAVAGRSVGGRELQVRRLARGEPAGRAHILFIGADVEKPRAQELLAQAQGHPVLTVTDNGAEHPQGSVINFLAATDRVRFDISREAAEKNGLQLRSQLLAVARQVSSP